MNWYYALNDEQKGPVEQAELDRLVQQGTITANTLVWHEGMPQWQPYGTTTLGSAVSSAPPVIGAGSDQGKCADCGQPFAPDELVQIGGKSVCARCKPLALQRLREGISRSDGNAEEVRKLHLNHEASIKSIGTLYLLGGIALAVLSVVILFAPTSPGRNAVGFSLGMATAYVLLAVVMFWLSFALKKLNPRARVVSAILAVLGLCSIPFGTLINGYILYLLFSEKGKMVFSDEYKEVIAATPHIKYRTSIVVWVLLIIVVLFLLVALGGAIFAGIRR